MSIIGAMSTVVVPGPFVFHLRERKLYGEKHFLSEASWSEVNLMARFEFYILERIGE